MRELTKAQQAFLRDLISWGGAATPRDLGPQTSQEANSARQFCKRHELVVFEVPYWRITYLGRYALGDGEDAKPAKAEEQ